MVLLWGFGTGLCFVTGVWCGAWMARENAVKEFKRVNSATLDQNKKIEDRLAEQAKDVGRIADAVCAIAQKGIERLK